MLRELIKGLVVVFMASSVIINNILRNTRSDKPQLPAKNVSSDGDIIDERYNPPPPPSLASEPETNESNFKPTELETLSGWKMAGNGRFEILQKENVLRTCGGMGLLWYFRRKFKDFILEVEWKASSKGDNSGVFVRFPNPGNDPYLAVKNGYEIQIDDLAQPDGKLIHATGSIYKIAAPSTINSKPIGEWNSLKIIVEKQKYSVITNDVKVIGDFTGNKLLEGYIGLQNHDDSSKVFFRNVKVRETSLV